MNFTCCPTKASALARLLVDYLKANNAADSFHGSIDFNPYKRAFRHGAEIDKDQVVADAKLMLSICAPVKGLRCLAVDSVVFCNSGRISSRNWALPWPGVPNGLHSSPMPA